MYLRMQRHASRADSSVIQLQLRVPRDVIDRVRGRTIEVDLPASPRDPAATFKIKLGEHAKGSLHTRDRATADTRRLAVLAHLSKVYEAARHGAVALSQRQVAFLSGEVYRRVRLTNDDSPGTPEQWSAWKAFTRAALEGRLEPSEARPASWSPRTEEQAAAAYLFGSDLTASVDSIPAGTYDDTALRERCGRLALWALHEAGIEADGPSQLALLREVARAALQAGWQHKRQSEGDWREDALAGRFPPSQAASAPTVSITELFDRWRAETKPAPSTVSTWRGVIRSLLTHLGHEDVARLTAADVIAWKDRLVSEGKRASTINDGHLAGLRTILAYGKRNRIVAENVATGVRVQDRRQAGTSMLPYDDSEVARLLKIAARETAPARRWLPWLAVYTGARIGELAQAWGSQVREVDGIPVLAIEPSPDGGTLKNVGSERIVPLHSALVDAGFIEFARSCGHRPMFYGRPARPGSEGRHPSKGATNHLATWIREQGFDDPRKAPSHACRHWWKSTASRIGIPDSLADAIQGHTDGSSAGLYRHFDLPAMAAAVRRISVSVSV